VIRQADQIELFDSSPEQLRRRMLHGNIYPPERVHQALNGFFQTDTLTALRELTLRFLADETEEDLVEQLQCAHTRRLWETAERVLVGVTAASGTATVMRRASRLAARLKADLHVVHVTSADAAGTALAGGIDDLRGLALELGAQWTELEGDDVAETLMEFARQWQVTQLVVGPSQRNRWQRLRGGGSTVRRLSRLAGEAGIDVHIIARTALTTPATRVPAEDDTRSGLGAPVT
jgi:two-component system, OmpR family, sensor histidine kinase KdpD